MMKNYKGKLFVFFPVFLLISGFSFARDIKVIGVIPSPDTGKTYQLQIGAFRTPANTNKAAATLTKYGLVPQYEEIQDPKQGALTRVFVVAGAKDVRCTIDLLGRAGFREVIIREYICKTEPEPEPEPEPLPMEPEPEPEPEPPPPPPPPREKPTLDFVKDPLRHIFPFPSSQNDLNTGVLRSIGVIGSRRS